MRQLRAVFLRFISFFRKDRQEQELDAELESHLAMHIEDNLRSGMTPQEARRAALMKLGGLEQTKELYRERRTLPSLEIFLQDIRYAVRMLRKSPGFTCIAIITLALGIGVNTTIFTAFDALILRPRAVKDPDHLAFPAGKPIARCNLRVSYIGHPPAHPMVD